MTTTIQIEGQDISCVFRKSKRAKRVSMTVYPDTSVVITVPQRVSYRFAESFFQKNMEWISQKVQEYNNSSVQMHCSGSKEEYRQYKEEARAIIQQKLEQFNQVYQFDFNRVFIRNQKTRWGSCSSGRNLSFNYQLLFLPEEMIEYVVVHELCHLQEMNHSKRFWNLVEQTIPEYKRIKKEMKHISIARSV